MSKGKLLMTTEQKIKTAEKLLNNLINVRRTEWNIFKEYFSQKKNFELSLKLIKKLSNSPQLRPRQTEAYRRIYKSLQKEKELLHQQNVEDLNEIFGYVSWLIVSPLGFGMWKEK